MHLILMSQKEHKRELKILKVKRDKINRLTAKTLSD